MYSNQQQLRRSRAITWYLFFDESVIPNFVDSVFDESVCSRGEGEIEDMSVEARSEF